MAAQRAALFISRRPLPGDRCRYLDPAGGVLDHPGARDRPGTAVARASRATNKRRHIRSIPSTVGVTRRLTISTTLHAMISPAPVLQVFATCRRFDLQRSSRLFLAGARHRPAIGAARATRLVGLKGSLAELSGGNQNDSHRNFRRNLHGLRADFAGDGRAPLRPETPCGIVHKQTREPLTDQRFWQLAEYRGKAFLDIRTCLVARLEVFDQPVTLSDAMFRCATLDQGGPSGEMGWQLPTMAQLTSSQLRTVDNSKRRVRSV